MVGEDKDAGGNFSHLGGGFVRIESKRSSENVGQSCLSVFRRPFVYGYILFAQERNIRYRVHLLCQAVQ